jgi:hypothetical protein
MITENPTVECFTEIPEALHESVQRYLEINKRHDFNDVVAMALSLFILQNKGPADKQAGRIYLDTLFRSPT